MKRSIYPPILLVAALGVSLTACGKPVVHQPEKTEVVQKKETGSIMQPIEPKQFGEVFLHEEYERIHAQMTKEFQQQVSSEELKQLAHPFQEGITGYTLQADVPIGNGYQQYLWLDQSGTKGLSAIFNQQQKINGLKIMPLKAFPQTDQAFTKNVFTPPVKQDWFVFWGGTNELFNYHYEQENQRYAYDLVIMKDGKTYQGDPSKNESYYAYGQEVSAAADGKVVKVENKIPDNVPVGTTNKTELLGNHVIIDHGNGEYSVTAHLKTDSLKVKVGDKVKRGEIIGLCGNSGNSSEAHIHFQVSNSPEVMNNKSIRIKWEGNANPIRGEYMKKGS
ncbi:peptidase M23 family protein [Brevibacillus laterosporus GI-9]|uniref:M23 family metallopeptidase n=1 Tax=Brevibacillus laterosporus TaxID=1465 RepID=UPI0002404AAE|nr:M23 family metallopeptidase [Brevibacillus laterosporus]CCF13147.1 peptidase M23 family protein [Brevibacillus laterosporus GI-9]